MRYNEVILDLILILIYYYMCEIIPTYNLKLTFGEGVVDVWVDVRE